MKRSARTARGFSLIEIAIVLSIIGAMIGAVWLATSQSWGTSEGARAAEEIKEVIIGVRNYYAGQLGMPNNGYVTLTPAMITNRIIPSHMQRTSNCSNSGGLCADNPWGSFAGGGIDGGGTFRVCNWIMGSSNSCPAGGGGGNTQFFGIALTGLTLRNCNMLISNVTAATGTPGLIDVNINGTNLAAIGRPVNPVRDTDSNAYCPHAPDGSTSVTFVYRLTTPR